MSNTQTKTTDDKELYIKEVQANRNRLLALINFTSSSTKAAAAMLVAAVVALCVANTNLYTPFIEFVETEVSISIGSFSGSMTFVEIINEILMAIFFLLVGLEIKYEMTVGELTNIRQALLPILAACGGVLAPIVIYSLINASHPESLSGWGVPTATDIAFALGIMSLLGDRVPNGIKVFLSTLAVADDIIAIIVIAIFYGQSPNFLWMALAALVFAGLILMNKRHVFSLAPYLFIGVVLWFCVLMSGIHSTIAGVLLAFVIPGGSHVNLKTFTKWSRQAVDDANSTYDENAPVLGQEAYLEKVVSLSRVARQVVPPAIRLEHKLYPWVYFLILPLFALTNADVRFVGGDMLALFTSPVMFGVFFGLLLGKPIGIMLFSFITVKLKIATLPKHVNWQHMLGAAILGGVGFTMAIFVANLAFTDATMITEAKVGILSASTIAGIIGFLFLLLQANHAHKRGIRFVSNDTVSSENQNGEEDNTLRKENKTIFTDNVVALNTINIEEAEKAMEYLEKANEKEAEQKQ